VHHVLSQQMLLLVLRCGDLQMGYYDLLLTYEDAVISPRDEWTLAKIARGTKDAWQGADVAYHELDQAEDGRIQHRILFHPGLWFGIDCGKLHWKKVDRPDREIPKLPDRFPGGPARPPAWTHRADMSDRTDSKGRRTRRRRR
jgi:hypothetical protein